MCSFFIFLCIYGKLAIYVNGKVKVVMMILRSVLFIAFYWFIIQHEIVIKTA